MSGYPELGESLRAADAAVVAAECHGFLCGQLCGITAPDEEVWREFLDLRTEDDRLAENCRAQVRWMLEDMQRQLRSPDFDFRLCLPDDDDALPERVLALAAWCQGFLAGFGLVPDVPARLLSGEVQEWLRDLDMIARAGVDESAADDDDELALEQVAEHVRTGVLLIFEELRAFSDTRAAEALH